jgi:hypothetical protein
MIFPIVTSIIGFATKAQLTRDASKRFLPYTYLMFAIITTVLSTISPLIIVCFVPSILLIVASINFILVTN